MNRMIGPLVLVASAAFFGTMGADREANGADRQVHSLCSMQLGDDEPLGEGEMIDASPPQVPPLAGVDSTGSEPDCLDDCLNLGDSLCRSCCEISRNFCCNDGVGWLDNTCVFIAGDGWKNIFDDDDNNNFGFRGGANIGFALPGPRAVHGQIGASYGAYDFHGRETLLSRDDPIEQQLFATAGVFKRSDVNCGDSLAWGVVYDLMASDAAGERADTIQLAQLRSHVGWALGQRNEVGVWMAFRLMNDYATAQRVTVSPTDQVNGFWHINWRFGGETTFYGGWADDPGQTVLGLTGRAPLNDHAALFGNVHYAIPSTMSGDVHPILGTDDMFAQEAWNVSFGIAIYPGSKAAARNVSGNYGMPLLPVADNGSFSFQAPVF